MRKLVKRILIQFRKRSNHISWNSDISLDTKLGFHNVIKKSELISCFIGDCCSLLSSRIYSSRLKGNVAVHESSIYGSVFSDNVSVGSFCHVSQSSMERYTYLVGNNRIFNSTIGAFCSIAENVTIGHAEHPTDFVATSPLFYKRDNPFNISKFIGNNYDEFKKTVIGNDVWIGMNAFVKSGVVIGNGAVIGAGAVVTKDVEPYAIVGGIPAKEIRKRFTALQIEELQENPWWNLDEHELERQRFKLSSRFHTRGIQQP